MMMEGSISKYNGLLLLTPSTNPMELFFLVLLWLALTYHPFFPFHALVSTDEHIIQKRGAFFYHFPAVCILKKRCLFTSLF